MPKKSRTKTNVLYNANLNNAQLKIHLEELIAKGLLTKKANNYLTTEKGNRYLELFAELNELLQP